jgi:hypothetical protein
LNEFIGCNQKVAVGQLLVFSDIYSKMTHEGVKKFAGLSGILADIKVNERLLDGISQLVI